ncbi:hypothetical protein F2Q69_00027904 [Brassica cretica]|uniref:Zinc finger LSD1-type domain-containing protein n=1 Tax=Brassica cretica TaxID=69181 RepID=A0A8S9S6I5_BRACR|nr:hypothetical protein F2Q69_00027904 [Brassica cretica]
MPLMYQYGARSVKCAVCSFVTSVEDHQFVGKLLGIYRGRTSSGYFDGLFDGPILGSSDEMFLGIFIGNFRGTEPLENSEERVPRYIPRNESLGIFRGMSPSVYSEEQFLRYIPRVHFLGI